MRSAGRLIALVLSAGALAGCNTLNNGKDTLLGVPIAPEATIVSRSNAGHDSTEISGGAAPMNIDKQVQAYAQAQLTTNCTLAANSAPDQFAQCRKIEIDELCVQFFTNLDGISTGAQFSGREVDIVSDTASTIMGLTGSPARALAILAGGKLAFDNSLSNAQAALLLSPTPSKVYRLVYNNQKGIYATRTAGMTFEESVSMMRQYAYACTAPGIRELIDAAVQVQTASTSATPANLSTIVDAVNAALPATATKVSLADITPDNAAKLYALFLTSAGNSSINQQRANTAFSPNLWGAVAPLLLPAYNGVTPDPNAGAKRAALVIALATANAADPTLGQRASSIFD